MFLPVSPPHPMLLLLGCCADVYVISRSVAIGQLADRDGGSDRLPCYDGA